ALCSALSIPTRATKQRSVVDFHPVPACEGREVVVVSLPHRAQPPLVGSAVDLGEHHGAFGGAGVEHEGRGGAGLTVDRDRYRAEFAEGAVAVDSRCDGDAFAFGGKFREVDADAVLTRTVDGQFDDAVV